MSIPQNSVYVSGQGAVSSDGLNTFLQGVTNVAALRQFTGQSGMTIYLQGLATFNDGGSSAFGWNATSTAADNGTTIIAPSGLTTGRWIALSNTGAVATNTVMGNSSGGNAAATPQTIGSGLSLVGGVLSANVQTILRDYLAGMNLANDGGTPNSVLDVSAGVCTDSTNVFLISLASSWTKSTAGTFVAGTGANGMGQGLTVTTSTWYHVFAIIVNGTADVYFDTSVSAANKPAGTTAFRRLGSFKTDGSSNILAFVQNGDRFDWGTPVADVTATPPDTNGHIVTLGSVPTGVIVQAVLTAFWSSSTASSPVMYLSSVAQADVAGTTTPTMQINGSGLVSTWLLLSTNTSGQVRYRAGVSTGTPSISLITNGWIDTRGRFA